VKLSCDGASEERNFALRQRNIQKQEIELMKEVKDFEIQNLESRLARIVEWVKTCDTKTSFLLAIVGVMLPLVLQSKLLQDDMMVAFKQMKCNEVCCLGFFGKFLFVVFAMGFGLLLLMSCKKFLNVLFAKRTESLNERIIGSDEGAIDKKIGDGSLDPLFRNSHCNATLSKREVAIDVRREDVRIKTVDV
jgi:hypothetical protein